MTHVLNVDRTTLCHLPPGESGISFDEARRQYARMQLGKAVDCPPCCEGVRRAAELGHDRHRWIPVTESLPDAEDLVIIAVQGEGDYSVQLGFVGEEDLWFDFNDQPIAVTHWMPLPEPPEAA